MLKPLNSSVCLEFHILLNYTFRNSLDYRATSCAFIDRKLTLLGNICVGVFLSGWSLSHIEKPQSDPFRNFSSLIKILVSNYCS